MALLTPTPPKALSPISQFSCRITHLESPLASEADNLDDSGGAAAASTPAVRSSMAAAEAAAAAALLSASGKSLDRRLFSPEKEEKDARFRT